MRPLNSDVRFRMRYTSPLALVVTVIFVCHSVTAHTRKTILVRISERDTCLIGDLEIPCRDVGTKLRKMAVPSDANIHVIAARSSKYQIISTTVDSLRSAGLKLGTALIGSGEK